MNGTDPLLDDGLAILHAAAKAVYDETKSLIAKVSREGWRPLFGWIAVYLFGGIAWRIVHGLGLPGLPELITALGTAFAPMILRGAEKYFEARMGGGLAGPGAQIGAA